MRHLKAMIPVVFLCAALLGLAGCGASTGDSSNNTSTNNGSEPAAAVANNSNAAGAGSAQNSQQEPDANTSSTDQGGSTSTSTTIVTYSSEVAAPSAAPSSTDSWAVGSWDLAAVAEYGETYSAEDMEILKSSGMTVRLDLKNDGTGTATVYAKSGNCTWGPNADGQLSLSLDGDTYLITRSDDGMLVSDGATDFGLKRG